MSNIEWRFESPWALLLLIPVLALTIVPWLFLPKGQRHGARKTVPVVLHAVISVVLVLVLSGISAASPDDGEKTDLAEEETEEEAGGGILILADSASEAETLRDFFPENRNAEVRPAEMAPLNISSLMNYEKILLLGPSANSLPQRLASQLVLYVEQGGKLLISASDHSYSYGAMRGTAYETLLPVSFDYTSEEGERVALMLVLDCSNSMTGAGGWWWGGSDNLSMAKQGAIRSIESLGEKDTVGIVSFNSTATLQSEPVPATETEKAVLSRVISSLGTSRGTYYCDALKLTWEQLRDNDAEIRHVIFLSDGEPSDSGYMDTVREMNEDGITLTAIAIGYSSYIMSRMAEEGGGRYYAVTSVSDLPEIMLGETETVVSDPLVTEKTEVALRGGLPTDLPPVSGYIGTTLKDGAELILQTETGDPILAHWTVGDGEADAFSSDLLGDWTAEWRETNPGRRMLRQIFSMGLTDPGEESGEEDGGIRIGEEAAVKRPLDLLLPLGLLLAVLMLVDIAVRKLRWKDIVLFFRGTPS